jgi:hypothetical protein
MHSSHHLCIRILDVIADPSNAFPKVKSSQGNEDLCANIVFIVPVGPPGNRLCDGVRGAGGLLGEGLMPVKDKRVRK